MIWLKIAKLRKHLSTAAVDHKSPMCETLYQIGEEVLKAPCGHSIHFRAGACGVYDTCLLPIALCPACGENFSDLVFIKYLSSNNIETILEYIL